VLATEDLAAKGSSVKENRSERKSLPRKDRSKGQIACERPLSFELSSEKLSFVSKTTSSKQLG
jgi:hypothetical protein